MFIKDKIDLFLRKLPIFAQLFGEIMRGRRDLAQTRKELASWNHIFSKCKKPILEVIGPSLFLENELVFYAPPHDEFNIVERFKEIGLEVVTHEVDVSQFQEYLDFANYASYPAYMNEFKKGLNNKFLQHYLSLVLLSDRGN